MPISFTVNSICNISSGRPIPLDFMSNQVDAVNATYHSVITMNFINSKTKGGVYL